MRLMYLAGAATVALLSGVSLVPASATAQPGGVSDACSIDPNSPKELAIQTLNFNRASSAQTPEARQQALRGVLKELSTKPERFSKNPAGYNYVLSQALVMWAIEPGVGEKPTRGSLGFVTNPEQPYDILVHLDSAYNAIVAALPACKTDIDAQRQNEAWLAVTRAALDASNGGKLDSAEHYAKRSLILTTANPYPYYVLANVANVRNDKKSAIENWKLVVDRAGNDTTYDDLKASSQYYIGMTQYEEASALKGDEQVAAAKEAAASLKALLESNPASSDASNILQALSDALTMSKQADAIPATYSDFIQHPEKTTDLTLTMAGVIATQLNRTDDAVKLFEGAVQQNPLARDALRNLAAAYHGKNEFAKMFDPAKRLVAIDPNNHDGWMLFAYAAQGLGQATKVPAERKAWTDTLVKYQSYADSLPVKVSISGFSRGAKSASLSMQLEQVAPTGNYQVTVEFLDKAGNVVATGVESSGEIKKGESKSVTVKADGENIYGYRYKALK